MCLVECALIIPNKSGRIFIQCSSKCYPRHTYRAVISGLIRTTQLFQTQYWIFMKNQAIKSGKFPVLDTFVAQPSREQQLESWRWYFCCWSPVWRVWCQEKLRGKCTAGEDWLWLWPISARARRPRRGRWCVVTKTSGGRGYPLKMPKPLAREVREAWYQNAAINPVPSVSSSRTAKRWFT